MVILDLVVREIKCKMHLRTLYLKKERVGNELCYDCGFVGHWYKNCHTSNKVAVNCKRYRESKEQDAHYMEEEDNDLKVNITIADFSGKKKNCSVNG